MFHIKNIVLGYNKIPVRGLYGYTNKEQTAYVNPTHAISLIRKFADVEDFLMD